MKTLYDPVTIGSLTLKNRLIRSATLERSADHDRSVLDSLKGIYSALADGGCGTIITGMMGIGGAASRLSASMVCTAAGGFVESLSDIVQSVHDRGAILIVQLAHCGAKSRHIEDGGQPLAPSDISLSSGQSARAMTREEIAAVAENFGKAAARCREAGADGVQIHAAHGFLVSQFLSPWFNRREDEYGGDIENRSRILVEILAAIQKAAGPDYPVWIKINGRDMKRPETGLAELCGLCTRLGEQGVSAIEVSAGIGVDPGSSPVPFAKQDGDEAWFADEALVLAGKTGVPVISVGGYRTPDRISRWLNRGGIKAISLSRPFIAEPGLVNRWQGGDSTRARCVSCNRCFNPKDAFSCQVFDPKGGLARM